MPICKTEEAIEEIRKGRMIILVDDEDRENEGPPRSSTSWPRTGAA